MKNLDEAIDSIGRAINTATYKIISDEQATKATMHLVDMREEIETLRADLETAQKALVHLWDHNAGQVPINRNGELWSEINTQVFHARAAAHAAAKEKGETK